MEDDHRIWRALADPTRRTLLDRLRDGPRTTGALAAGLAVTRFAVMKHLGVLVDAGLVTVERRGRERLNHLDTAPLRRVHDRWMAPYTGQPAPPVRNPAPEPRPERAGAAVDTPAGHPVELRAGTTVGAARPRVYEALLDIGAWWPRRHRAGSYVVLEPHLGGRLYEDWGTGGALYGTVTALDDGGHLGLAGLMDVPGAVAGWLGIDLADLAEPAGSAGSSDPGGGTAVTLTHHMVGDVPAEMVERCRVEWRSALGALRAHATRA